MNIDDLKRDFRIARVWWVDVLGLSSDEVKEFGDAIASAISAKKADELACWANWVAVHAAKAKSYLAHRGGVNQRIRELLEKERAEKVKENAK